MIPVSEPHFTDDDIRLVNECLLSGWVTTGDYIPKFEQAWAEYCGRKHGIAVANGTVALELALELLDLKPDEEVIIPSFTIISCALAVIRAGGTPVLVDCDDTWCLDQDLVEAAITPKTRAIMAVHVYGLPVASEKLQKLAASKGVPIIEDAAEGHGAAFLGKRCGSLGLLSCFSFYGNKLITTGEGGMILTDN
jgi:perosamine synthetase